MAVVSKVLGDLGVLVFILDERNMEVYVKSGVEMEDLGKTLGYIAGIMVL